VEPVLSSPDISLYDIKRGVVHEGPDSCLLRCPAGAGSRRSGACPDRPGAVDGHRDRFTGRRPSGCDRDREITVADGHADRRHRGRRQVFDCCVAIGRVRADIRAIRVCAVQARKSEARPRPDSDRGQPAAGRHAAGVRNRLGRVSGGRHAEHEGRDGLHQRQAGRRADRHRHLGGARPGVGRADERVRRGRKPQEPADRIRELRRAPVARASMPITSPTKKLPFPQPAETWR
jgi:hypothetical protein